MMNQYKAQVFVIGAGPIGLTLAIDLAQRGIEVLLAESRHQGEPPPPKCNHTSARSMEIFRRLGVSKALRETGLPEDYPNDVAYRTTFTGKELSRIPIPARKDRYTATGGPDTWWPTAEPPHRINQIYLEPVLFEHAAATPGVRILNRVHIDKFTQDESGTTATGVHLDTGEPLTVKADFLIGCDGGRSKVRDEIGATLTGVGVVGRVQSTYIRAPELINLQKDDRAWATFSLNPRRSGNVYAIDGVETWVIHNYLREDEPDDSVDRDWAIREILGVGEDFKYETIANMDWVGRRLVADRFRDRRFFICGDAAHIWFPMAGYGMNAGIADAMNLSWTLAAYLQGWGGKTMLDVYQAERQPITEQVSMFVMNHAYALAAKRKGVPQDIELEGPEGERIRAEVGKEMYDLNVQQYCCAGLNFGYFYDKSEVIAYDDEKAPSYSMSEFTSSTVPGCRLPHVWLSGKKSLYDELGNWFTLVRIDSKIDTQSLEDAACKRGVPLKVLDISNEDTEELYKQKLVLVRPDQHIAWRGDEVPQDSLALIDLIRGA
jgi:2-polyprenyl-6-methoxyphenol hydroxylase-like FAD-dependent oxidoreductase